MVLSEYPRLPVGYEVNHAKRHSTSSRSIFLSSLKTTHNAQRHHDLDVELVLRASCIWVLSAKTGEETVGFVQDEKEVIRGDTAGTIANLLQQCGTSSSIGQETVVPFMFSCHFGESHRPNTLIPRLSPALLVAVITSELLELSFSHDVEIIPELEARWFLHHLSAAFHLLLTSFEGALISALSLIEEEEKRLIDKLGRSPPPPCIYPSSIKTLPSIFLHARSQAPEAAALQFDTTSISYDQLYVLAACLSRQLLSIGLKPGTVVPVCCEKSIEMIVSILAIELAGCAYLNIEPTWPMGRQEGIARELGRKNWLGNGGIALVYDNEDGKQWKTWETKPNTSMKIFTHILDPRSIVRPMLENLSSYQTFQFPQPCDLPQPADSDPAYLIYTSGSTGAPKGIIVEHRNVVAFLRNYRGIFGRAPGERVLQFPSYSFDVSVMNIWDTFAHGATLCMTSSSNLMSDLAGSILRLECTLLDLTPTISTLLFECVEAQPRGDETIKEAWDRAGFRIKVVNTGGEKVERWVLDAWAQRGVKVVIDYGPTETTVGVISNTKPVPSDVVPIGRPTGSTRILILTPSLQLAPLGCIGEICVSGDQVTRGYVQAELNVGAFLQHPTYGRIYRTGDLGRFLADEDGNIECIGRRDGQVKINGLRIEIGEIEKHLSSKMNTNLSRGVVVKIEREDLAVGLVAVLTISPSLLSLLKIDSILDTDDVQILPISSRREYTELVDDVKAQLAKQLPSYMVPRYWLPVSHIPTQGMGKTDRKCLRLLAESHDFRKNKKAKNYDVNKKKPDQVGQTIASDKWHNSVRKAWARVLRVGESELTDDDDFTKMGGDSIGFLKVISILRSEGFRVSFPKILEAARLSDFALNLKKCEDERSNVDSHKEIDSTYSILPDSLIHKIKMELQEEHGIQADDVEDIYPTSPSQDALIAGSIDSTHYYSQAIYALDRDVPIDRLQSALTTLITKYPVLRTCFGIVEDSDSALQIVLKADADVVKRCARIEHLAIEEDHVAQSLSKWMDNDRTAHDFSWGRLLLSFAVFTDARGTRKFAWSMHHAMSDGWTLELLTADLRAICYNLSVPDRPSFSNFVSWWKSIPDASDQTLSFWRSYMTGSRPLCWPSKAPLKGAKLSTSHEETMIWSGDLKQISKQYGITPAIASRVAIAAAVGQYASSSDVMLGIVRSGRDIPVEDADKIIGPCVSVLPSRIRFQKGMTLLTVAMQEAKADLQARAYQHVTLSEITRLCGFSSRSDVFDILVTYQSLAERDEEEMKLAPWPIQQPPEQIRMPTSYTLSLEITPVHNQPNKLLLACYYDVRVISSESVLNLLRSIMDILNALVSKPDTFLNQWISQVGEHHDIRSNTTKRTPQTVPGSNRPAEVREKKIQIFIDKLKPIWASILRYPEDDISPDETFASSGGDSISMMRLSAKLSKANLRIPLCDLSNLFTIRAQAEYLAIKKE